MLRTPSVSIPSRGFWFFEVVFHRFRQPSALRGFQSPRGDFGFLKVLLSYADILDVYDGFQSPRGDFGFLKLGRVLVGAGVGVIVFQSPRGDFGFLKQTWPGCRKCSFSLRFNPLAGILVF